MKLKVLLTIHICMFALFPFLIGCLNLERSYPEKRYFVLEASRDGKSPSPNTGTVLAVRRFRVSPQYEDKRLTYQLSDLSYESDFYNEFFVSPTSMLTDKVHLWMEETGLFQHIITPSSYLEPTHILEGTVTALYGDYRESTSPKAVLEIHFFLLHQVSDRYEIIFERQYRKEEPFLGNTPDDLVKGWNKALNQILTSFETDLLRRTYMEMHPG